MKLSGVAAIITGGATGLGAGTARVLAEAGAKVALLDLKEAEMSETAAAIDGLALACDVTDETAVSRALEQASAAHGVARIVVNCAGIGPHNKIVRGKGPHSLDLFEQVIRVNLTGTFNVCRMTAYAMIDLEPRDDGERGVLINTASTSAYQSPAGGCAYGASKAGVAGMTLPMARDLAEYGIRVMAIAPGPFQTPMFETMPPDMTDRLVGYNAFPKRTGNPLEFGRLVKQIAENRMLNGEVIRLDAGGMPPASFV